MARPSQNDLLKEPAKRDPPIWHSQGFSAAGPLVFKEHFCEAQGGGVPCRSQQTRAAHVAYVAYASAAAPEVVQGKGVLAVLKPGNCTSPDPSRGHFPQPYPLAFV